MNVSPHRAGKSVELGSSSSSSGSTDITPFSVAPIGVTLSRKLFEEPDEQSGRPPQQANLQQLAAMQGERPELENMLLPRCTHRIASRTERHANVDCCAFFGLRID